MAMTLAEKVKKRVGERVKRQVTFKNWQYQGNAFKSTEYYRISAEFLFEVSLWCDLKQLKAQVTIGNDYDGSLQVMGEGSFEFENATETCIDWITNTLIESDQELRERVKPYEAGYYGYKNALRLH